MPVILTGPGSFVSGGLASYRRRTRLRAALEDPVAGTSVIVSGARTPIGKLSGALKGFTAMDLGGIAVEAALQRAGITGDQVDYVILGHVLQAGQGQITARQAAVKGGVPMSVPALTINKVCLSGLDAIALADQLIRAGEYDVVVAGGMESMTNAPHLLPGARAGYRYGNAQVVDATLHDGLFCAFDQVAMGAGTEEHGRKLNIPREEQDAFAVRSHERATAAQKDGRFDEEIVPVPIPQRKGEPVMFTVDEGVRPETTSESLAKLKPAFSADGTVTAGNASQISDGACAVVVMSEERARELGAPVLARIGAHGVVAGPDASLQSQPANAIKKALAKEGLTVDDLDLVELNEAFAQVGIQSRKELGIDEDKVNVNGGAISLGHPIGMSGARVALHLVLELKRRGGGTGAAALCGGGGQGDALVLHVPA
jgi:acetyl-CoA C-acetyltransferase